MSEPFAFIVFEGLDCGGKSHQSKRVVEKLRAEGRDVLQVSDPGTTELGVMIRKILLDPSNKPYMCPYSELMLFAAARASLATYIRTEMRKRPGLIIVSDRFIHSTLAYQGFGRKLDRRKVASSIEASCAVYPTLTLYLEVDEGTIIERMAKRCNEGQIADRLEQENVMFRDRVREGYKYHTQNAYWKYGEIETIDGNPAGDTVFEEVIRVVNRHLEDRKELFTT